jgi:AcrR family transcriptional regulator
MMTIPETSATPDTLASKLASRPAAVNVKEALLESALRLLAAHGRDGATTRAICAEVGVGAPTLYHHWGDLNSLHQAAIRQAFTAISACYRPRAQGSDPLQSVRDSWSMLMKFAQEHPRMCRLVIQQTINREMEPGVSTIFDSIVSDLNELYQEGKMAMAPATAAYMFWAGAIGAAALLAHGEQGKPVDDSVAQVMLEALLAALFVRPAP